MRANTLARLREELFDVLILGGGVNGAGVARDLALRARRLGRPLAIGLIEQRHFASGASGRNSQLLHGGLRYLEHLHFGLVREALAERVTLRNIAPHLVDPLPFLIPFYGWFARQYYGAGLWLYDVLAGSRNIGRRRFLSREDVARAEPGLARERLHSAGMYYDCRVNAARLVLENIFEAQDNGAAIANYVRAGRPCSQAHGYTTPVTDMVAGDSFDIRARQVVDARGPWDDTGSVRLVRGSHIIVPRIASPDHAIAYFHDDGRIIFVIPWGPSQSLSLVGTTDVDHRNGPDSVHITPEEVQYLEGVLRRLFPETAIGQPVAAYSSLRPLIESGGAAKSASREHKIFFDPAGILRITGGKYTTYRTMSAEAADLIAGQVAPELRGKCETATTPVNGNSPEAIAAFEGRAPALAARRGIETREVLALIHTHGLRAEAVLESLPAATLECAIVAHAVRAEMALRLPDLAFVSTYWGFERRLDWRQLACAMGSHLGWEEPRIQEEADLAASIAALP